METGASSSAFVEAKASIKSGKYRKRRDCGKHMMETGAASAFVEVKAGMETMETSKDTGAASDFRQE